MLPPPPTAPDDARLKLIIDSHLRLTGRPLVPPGGPEMHPRIALWHAPAVIVAHGTEADPIFFYGNHRALRLFEMTFADFTRLPSRFSAQAPAPDERARLLGQVQRDGFIDHYAGVRISSTGQRFMIHEAVVWNLIDEHGQHHGQGASFARWSALASAHTR